MADRRFDRPPWVFLRLTATVHGQPLPSARLSLQVLPPSSRFGPSPTGAVNGVSPGRLPMATHATISDGVDKLQKTRLNVPACDRATAWPEEGNARIRVMQLLRAPRQGRPSRVESCQGTPGCGESSGAMETKVARQGEDRQHGAAWMPAFAGQGVGYTAGRGLCRAWILPPNAPSERTLPVGTSVWTIRRVDSRRAGLCSNARHGKGEDAVARVMRALTWIS